MKLATLRTPYGTTAIRVEGTGVGTQLDFEDIGTLLRTEDWRKTAALSGETITFRPADLAPVIPNPGKIICVDANYAAAIRATNQAAPAAPTLFIKFPDALTGPYDTVHIPPFGQSQLDYGGQLAVVIGARTHHVSSQHALDHVAGYTIINDYTLRDFQQATSQFHAGKSFYRTAGFGPWLTTADAWSPGLKARVRTTVDDELRQEDNTDDLVFSVPELIAFISQLYPLNPGDVIATGTPAGLGGDHEPPAFLRDGQVTRVEVDGLGYISNQTIFDAAPTPSLAGKDLLGSSFNFSSPGDDDFDDVSDCGPGCACGHNR